MMMTRKIWQKYQYLYPSYGLNRVSGALAVGSRPAAACLPQYLLRMCGRRRRGMTDKQRNRLKPFSHRSRNTATTNIHHGRRRLWFMYTEPNNAGMMLPQCVISISMPAFWKQKKARCVRQQRRTGCVPSCHFAPLHRCRFNSVTTSLWALRQNNNAPPHFVFTSVYHLYGMLMWNNGATLPLWKGGVKRA